MTTNSTYQALCDPRAQFVCPGTLPAIGTHSTRHYYNRTKWAGSLGLPATPAKPLTAAALPRTAQVAHAAGRAGMLSSPVWTEMTFSTESKMTRRRAGNAQRRLRSLRLPVRRLGYVQIARPYRAMDACPKGNKPILGSHMSMMAVHVFQIILNANLSFDCLGQIFQGKACDGIQPRQDD